MPVQQTRPVVASNAQEEAIDAAFAYPNTASESELDEADPVKAVISSPTSVSSRWPGVIAGLVVLSLIVGSLYYVQTLQKADKEKGEKQRTANEVAAAQAARDRQRDADANPNANANAARAANEALVRTAAATTGNRVEAPGASVGDTYTYETIDHVEPKLSNVTSREIVAATPFEVTMKFVNAKSRYSRFLTYDRDLGLLSTRSDGNEGTDYRPPIKYFSFPIQPGDTWNASSTETNIKTGKTRMHTLTARVEGFEMVAVPAGTFRALKIIIDSQLQDGSVINTGKDVSWYAPEVRRTVKSELESRDGDTGKVGQRTVILTAYSLR